MQDTETYRKLRAIAIKIGKYFQKYSSRPASPAGGRSFGITTKPSNGAGPLRENVTS
jgi:hypothetical protein